MARGNLFDYASPYRKNFEIRIVVGWLITVAVAFQVMVLSHLPSEPFYIMMVFSSLMAVGQVNGAYATYVNKKNLEGFPTEFYTPKDLKKLMKKNPGKLWLGTGFTWTQAHAQGSFEILKSDVREILSDKQVRNEETVGSRWIHGLEPKKKEINLVQNLEHTSLMTLICGSTGSGKTRMFETLITQAVLRGECVIIIDPKGDLDLKNSAKRACAMAGDVDRFVYFHPAFPFDEDAVRLDPLKNFNQPTDVASRIAEIIPAEGDGVAFVNFAFMAMNNIVQALLITEERPTLKNIKTYLDRGVDGLTYRAVSSYMDLKAPGWEKMVRADLNKAKDMHKKAQIVTEYYDEHIAGENGMGSSDVDGLISMFRHNKEHLGKMISSVLPVLTQLTSGDVGRMLSPDVDDEADHRPILDTTRIINQGMVLVLGLDSLSNNTVGSAIGSIFVSELASIAGARYNYGVNNKPVNIFIDEASEVLGGGGKLLQILNKGRGSQLNTTLAIQSIKDLSARLGDEAAAMQFLGNLNNLIALRTIDNESQKYITENLYTTRVQYIMRTQGSNTETGSAIAHGGNVGERLMEEESELFPAQMLGMLPNLEYIAKLAGGRIVKGRIPILLEEKK